MLKQRIITALILVTILIGAIFFLPFYFFAAIVSVFFIVAAWEWGQFPRFSYLGRIIFTLLVAAVSAFLFVWVLFDFSIGESKKIFFDQEKMVWLAGAATSWWLIAVMLVKAYPSGVSLWRNRWVQSIIGFLVLVPTLLGIIFLHQQKNGPWLIMIVVACVVCADTGAYFVGRAFGKNKLAPNVSPGKSREGFYGGLGCSGIFAIILAISLGALEASANWWVLAMIIPASLISVLGDLLESMFKRERGIKDSGKILPGHGGVLDRIDSITAAIPIFTLVYILSGWQL
ncbi:MAG: phosphatidate cytidylyltransferase [Cellvibrionaceae bacterium]